MTQAPAESSIEIAVPQRYKDFVVKRQYRWFWLILLGVLGGINVVYYLLCITFHWNWQFHFQGDLVLPIMGLIAYVVEVRKPWRYRINERAIQLFVITPKTQLGNLKEIEWAKTEVVGIEQGEWQGLPVLSLTVLPSFGYSYLLVYSPADEEEVETKVLPLIERYLRSYRKSLWADRLRS